MAALTRWIFPGNPRRQHGDRFRGDGTRHLPADHKPLPKAGPQAAPASQSGVVGQWRALLSGSTYTITIDANGQYTQLAVPQKQA